MRHPDLDQFMAMERRKDELRAAEHSRLVREARMAAPPPMSLRLAALALSRSLAFLGAQLLAWSERLQCRYSILTAGAENQPEPCS
jgi:hypothetical protein